MSHTQRLSDKKRGSEQMSGMTCLPNAILWEVNSYLGPIMSYKAHFCLSYRIREARWTENITHMHHTYEILIGNFKRSSL